MKQKALKSTSALPVGLRQPAGYDVLEKRLRPDAGGERRKPGSDPGGVGAFGREDRAIGRELGAPIGGAGLLSGFFFDCLDGFDDLFILLLERFGAIGDLLVR